MKKVYEVRKYNLKGKVFFTCQERPDLEMREENGMKRYYNFGTNVEAFRSNLWEYTTTPPKENVVDSEEKFIPYFADVTEDISSHFKVKPKTYKNCQLMTETHGGYLQFWHEPTKQVLRIAMNSHYYTPIEKK